MRAWNKLDEFTSATRKTRRWKKRYLVSRRRKLLWKINFKIKTEELAAGRQNIQTQQTKIVIVEKSVIEQKKKIERLIRDLEGSAAVGANAGVVSSQMEEIMHALREHEKEVNNLQGELTRLNLAAATPTGHDFRPNSVSASREGERRLDRTEHQLALQEIQLSEQDLQIQMLEATSYNGTYIWKSTITADDFKKLLLVRCHRFIALRSTLDGLGTKSVPVSIPMVMVWA
ncbi:TNF receptor-associated factor 3 [Desmophyllum pertusum]|uniref:TNF receptor-associated factor 3 n=1 Tax=Desmophyllum pertusum TaxID=174260 RepID=A0A9W9YPP4_9CNID|nr:TNF receptor-associated factor 3 [Desmophyllum pertusum]